MTGDDDWEDAVITIDGKPLGARPTGKKSAAGAKESKLWAEIVPHLRATFPSSAPSRNTSFHAVKDFLVKKRKTLSDSAIRAGIKRHFPEWN